MIRRLALLAVVLVPTVAACNALGLDLHDPAGPAVMRSPVYVTPAGSGVEVAEPGSVRPPAPDPGSALVAGSDHLLNRGTSANGSLPAPSQVAVRGRAVQLTDTNPPPVVAQSAPAPVDGDCESWRPLLVEHGMPFDVVRPVMWRESRCSNAHNWNPSTRDDSFGVLQVNRYGRLGSAWDAAGFSREFMATPEGGVAAAALLYQSCGLGPWTKPYGCPGGWPL